MGGRAKTAPSPSPPRRTRRSLFSRLALKRSQTSPGAAAAAAAVDTDAAWPCSEDLPPSRLR